MHDIQFELIDISQSTRFNDLRRIKDANNLIAQIPETLIVDENDLE